MRVAIISDIHANLEALEVVLEDIARRECGLTVCLGDFVGYGPNPNECVDRLSPRLAGRNVAGNHDRAAIGRLDISFFNPVAQEAILWTQRTLRAPVQHYLTALPAEWTHDGPLPFLAVHASPREPIEEYVLDAATAAASFRHRSFALCFHGHTHVPALFVAADGAVDARAFVPEQAVRLEPDRRYMINVGSVGQPRDGDPRAAYAVLDTESALVHLIRLPYPLEQTQAKMYHEGLPPILAERLSVGR